LGTEKGRVLDLQDGNVLIADAVLDRKSGAAADDDEDDEDDEVKPTPVLASDQDEMGAVLRLCLRW
jgi:hypothetical protein